MDPLSLAVGGALLGAAAALDPNRGQRYKNITSELEENLPTSQSWDIPYLGPGTRTYGEGNLIYANGDGTNAAYVSGVITGRSEYVEPGQIPIRQERFGITGVSDGDRARKRHVHEASENMTLQGSGNGTEFVSGDKLPDKINPQQAHFDSRYQVTIPTLKAENHITGGVATGTMGRTDLIQGRPYDSSTFQEQVRLPERAVGVLENRAGIPSYFSKMNSTILNPYVETDDPYTYLKTPERLLENRAPNPDNYAWTEARLTGVEGHATKKHHIQGRAGVPCKTAMGQGFTLYSDVMEKGRKVNTLPALTSHPANVLAPQNNKNDTKSEETTHQPLRSGLRNRESVAFHGANVPVLKNYQNQRFHNEEDNFNRRLDPSGTIGEIAQDIDSSEYLNMMTGNPYFIDPYKVSKVPVGFQTITVG